MMDGLLFSLSDCSVLLLSQPCLIFLLMVSFMPSTATQRPLNVASYFAQVGLICCHLCLPETGDTSSSSTHSLSPSQYCFGAQLLFGWHGLPDHQVAGLFSQDLC